MHRIWSEKRSFLAPIFIVVLLALPACVATQSTSLNTIAEEALVWSDLEERLTVRWVDEVRQYEDLEIKRSFLDKMSVFFFGRDGRQIVKPHGLLVDRSKTLLIADPGAGLVHSMNLETFAYKTVTRSEEEAFSTPIGIASDHNGSIYFTDSSLGKVYVVGLDDDLPKPFNKTVLLRPTDIAFNGNNWLVYVIDTVAHQVVVFGSDGQERFRFGERGVGAGQFNFPTDIWIDNQNHVYVNDSLNARIQVFSAGGEFLREVGHRGHAPGYLDRPKGIAVDKYSNLYVCDSLQDSVQVFDRDGNFLMTFGSKGRQPGQFWMPSGLYISDDNKIYVADSYNSRVQIFEYSGKK